MGSAEEADPMDEPTRPALQRDTGSGMLAGVAAGLARSLGIDVTLVRIAFVLTTLFLGGLGLVAYLAAWVLMPATGDPAEASDAARRLEALTRGRGAAFWVGVILIGLGGLALLDAILAPFALRLWFGSLRELVPPLILILVGVLLWRSSDRRGTRPAGDAARGLGDEVRALGTEVRRDVGAAFRTVGEEVSTIEEQLERYEQRRRDERDGDGVRLGRLTFGLATLTFGALWIADSLGLTALGLGRVAAVALAVIAGGLIVGSFVGHPRGLAWAGIALAPLVIVSIIGRGLPLAVDDLVIVGRDGTTTGELTVRPPTLADGVLRDGGYEFGIGQVEVDLTGLDVTALRSPDDQELTIELGIGELTIVLPDTITFDIETELGIGRLEVLGVDSSGFGLERRTLAASSDPAAPRVRLVVSQGIGRLIVIRSTS
jgi:phage shock protein PspC (stress-responsive transcriptional regulator)